MTIPQRSSDHAGPGRPSTAAAGSSGGIFEVRHPLIERHLTRMRDVGTAPTDFRHSVRRLAALMAYEATKDLPTEAVEVQTPLATAAGVKLRGRIGLAPILRAGLGMVDPILDLLPMAEVWHLGLYRDEDTAEPVRYYDKLPAHSPVDVALVLDPMLATGGSVSAALATLREWGVGRLKVLSLIASRQGLAAVATEFPAVQIYVCQIDPELDSRKFIVPGLGDAGDRIFNTVVS